MENEIKLLLGEEQKEEIIKKLVKDLKEEIQQALLDVNTLKAVDKKELAKMMEMSERSIDKLRNEGMPYFKLGNIVRYEISEVKKWIVNYNKEGGQYNVSK